MSNLLERMNPFYKFIAISLVATLLTFIHSYAANFWVFMGCLLIFFLGTRPQTWWRGAKIFIPIIGVGMGIFLTGAIWGDTGAESQFGTLTLASTQTGLNLLWRFFSFSALGLLICLTTDAYDLVKSIQKQTKIPRKFTYGLMSAVNMVPHMTTEYRNARLAFAVRGAKAGPFSLKVIFAMLVNCFRWSEMLAIAMISKGFHE
ncbi:MAG: energy-coupling factor transporter transmembrane protein EcfT [Defluviitaleaceae bacterium]|nr:energy-coupling factor transporter transmembrane protein EcfT [Defluviitaleaceae bacterium]